jgi:hypothetical protein
MKAVLQLYIEGTRVDLFEDESINVIQSIQNVKDISKIFVDFTRTFNIPASKTNNKIFQHYYNYSIVDGFDARLKKDATLELNTRPFKIGKVKLNGVDLVDGEPTSYRITFFGNTIDLKDLLGDDDLSSLDLTSFDTTYNAATVKKRLEGIETRVVYSHPDRTTDIVYPLGLVAPLISHTTRLYYDTSDTADYPDADGGNLYPSGTSHQGVYWEELKYAIKIDAIIRAVEDKYGLTFSNDFFNNTNNPYYDLYLWLHRKKGKAYESVEVSKQVTGFFIDRFQELPHVRSESDRLIVQGATGLVQYSLTVVASTNITGTVIVKKDGITHDQRAITNSTSITLSGYLDNGTYTVFIKSTASSFNLTTDTQWDVDLTYYPDSTAEYPLTSTYTFDNTREFIISEQIPEMKVIDFLTGLFKMFNLTAYTDNGVIVVKTLDEYYDDSDTVWDITEHVDTAQSSVDVALPYKEVEFKYEGLETKLAKQHEQLSNISWGTEEYRGDDYYDANPETYVVELPFEHMKYEKLNGDGTNLDPQVGWFVNDNNTAYYGKPLIFYAKKPTSTQTEIRFLITENSGSPDVEGINFNDISSYFVPSNSMQLDNTVSEANINFRNEINEFTLTNQFEDTLFKVYYQNYISQVFQNNRRLTTVYAYLPMKMLQEFILADIIAITDRNYTINEIETDFSTGRSKIELINAVTVSVGGSDPIDPTTTVDPSEVCEECTADSSFCTVDSLTPTADKTCDIARSLTIAGPLTAQQTNNITLEATANNFIGTASYLWAGGEAAGETTSSITITNADTGNVTYTCTATDDDDDEEFPDTHTVLWTPKTFKITLNIVDNISSPTSAAYNITGDQDGDFVELQIGETYSFNTLVNANSGYEFTSGPTIQNATGVVGTSNQTVNTTLSGSIQLTTVFITIAGPTQKTVNTDARLTTSATGFTPTSYQWARSTDGGSTFVNESGETNSYYDANESTAATYTYRVTASDGTNTAQDVYNVTFVPVTQPLVTVTLAVDTSNIVGTGYSPASNGFTLGGDLNGAQKTQNSGTVFSFSTTITLNSGYEWVGTPLSANNVGGTYTADATQNSVFPAGEIQLIVYNYYIVTGCPNTNVAGQTIYIRSRDTYTTGSTSTGSYLTISNNCYYASSTTFESTWASNNGITVGNAEGTGCTTCTDPETTDPCLPSKSLFSLRYSTTSDVCESASSIGFYYGNGASLSQTQTNFCNLTNLYTYDDCTVAAPTGFYSLNTDNTVRRYWNGSSFSVCTNCIDAQSLIYLGGGWSPINDYCNTSFGVQGFYYFDDNASFETATTSQYMYDQPSLINTSNYSAAGYYSNGSIYRYYDPAEEVWSVSGTCPVPPTPPACSEPVKPTLTVWREYRECGGDSFITLGNSSTAGFPSVVEDRLTGVCYGDPEPITGNQDDDWVLSRTCVGNTLTYDYIGFDDCTACTGTTTTTTTTTTTELPDNAFVVERQSDGRATYVQLDSGFQVGDINVSISTDAGECYDIQGSARVTQEYLQTLGQITGSCTTTTTTTTTTTEICHAVSLYGVAYEDPFGGSLSGTPTQVCCEEVTANTFYLNTSSLSTATVVYSGDTCTTGLTFKYYFTQDFVNYYNWNGSTLSGPTSCPACP